MYYANLLCILHCAYGLSFGEISWDSNVFVKLINAISMRPKIIRSQYHSFPKANTAQGVQYEFIRAQNLLQNVTLSTSRAEFQLLSLMSKEFLTIALQRDGSKGIINAALSYMAALHYATSEYQKATRLCSTVLMNHKHQEDKETLDAGCLLFIDDIASIVGLSVLQKKITESNLHYHNRRLYLDLRLSPQVLAEYVFIVSVERMYKQSDCYHDLHDSSFPMDVNLTTLMKSMKSRYHYFAARQLVYRRSDYETETVVSSVNTKIFKQRLLDALMEYASENMASFYNVIRKDFNCNTDDCYRALYLYKCRQYDEVLYLCDRSLHEPELQNDLREFAFANVLLLPPLDSLFDSDVQSLLGFHTLFYYLFALSDDLGKTELTDNNSPFQHWFARVVYNYKHILVHCLGCPDSITCSYMLGRHFLARYLKLRCCFDCKLPHSEALSEFAAYKANLPFEHIIGRFFLLNKTNS